MVKKMQKKQKHNMQPALEAVRNARIERENKGIFPAEFMRLSLTDDAFNITKDMENPTFREFVSAAIRRAARR